MQPGDSWRQDLAEELVGRARSEGVQLTGPGGLLTGITDAGPVRIRAPSLAPSHKRTPGIGLKLLTTKAHAADPVAGPNQVTSTAADTRTSVARMSRRSSVAPIMRVP